MARYSDTYTEIAVDNITINGNTISSTDSNGNINLRPHGTGLATVLDANFAILDNSDETKILKFQVSGITTATTRTITVPDDDITLVGAAATQTLTNKTLTSPVLTTPQINDTTADHQYVFAVNELSADRTVTLPLLAGNDIFVFEAHIQTLTNKTLTAPKIGTSILDANGNELFLLTATGSAVNELTYANAATGNNPSFAATGGDANIGITFTPKGIGGLSSVSGATTGNALALTASALTSGDALLITSDSADTSARALIKLINDNTAAVGTYGLEIQQDAVVSTNFKRLLLLAGVSLWISDGTTANGNLSGTVGDICFNAGSNKPEYCTGTTNWTALV